MNPSTGIRIGVFTDHCGGILSPILTPETINYIETLPNVAFCIQEADLTSPEALGRLADILGREKVSRVVIVGGSPKRYERSFRKFTKDTPLNPYTFLMANIREQVLWVMEDWEAAIEKSRKAIAKVMELAPLADPIGEETVEVKPQALVVGGGIVGLVAALSLAESEIQVTLLEKGESMGGRVSGLSHFSNRTEDVSQWLGSWLARVEESPYIKTMTGVELIGFEGHIGSFEARVRDKSGKETALSASAVIVATGYGVETESTGIFAHRRVISPQRMEEMIRGASDAQLLDEAGKTMKTVTFLLDLVNEDNKIDSVNAVKNAILLRDRYGCSVYILCKDVKVSAEGMEALYRQAREKGTVFIKYEDPPKLALVDSQINIIVKDTSAIRATDQWEISILSDLVVASERFVPQGDNGNLSQLLRIHVGPDGYLVEDNPQLMGIRSNRRGIFIAGGCRYPQIVDAALAEARAAAEEVVKICSKEVFAFDLAVAEVDPHKCAVCYTCPRVCPHSAITVERYADKNVYGNGGMDRAMGAAKVNSGSCYGCGICVSECPAKAITLKHYSDDYILIQLSP